MEAHARLPIGLEEPPPTPVGPPPLPPPGPIAQSVAVGFKAMYVAAALLLLFWATNNVRQIASDSQVVVRRFGRIVRSQEAGLLVAWPSPLEEVQVLPGPGRQLTQDVSSLLAPSDKYQSVIGGMTTASTGGATPASNDGAPTPTAPQNASAFLTGDGNVVLLSSSLIYRINDPIAYALEEAHVAPALDRLFRATAVHVTAGRNLNDFLVVQTADQSDSGQSLIALRSEVRESFLKTINDRLHAMEATGADLGIEVQQINLTPSLPPDAKTAFDQVLVATQAADRGVAMARTDAERRRQQSNSEAARLVSAAQATATETVTKASVDTATITALVSNQTDAQSRRSLLLREYRARVANIMDRTGRVTLVDPKGGARVILPGK